MKIYKKLFNVSKIKHSFYILKFKFNNNKFNNNNNNNNQITIIACIL